MALLEELIFREEVLRRLSRSLHKLRGFTSGRDRSLSRDMMYLPLLVMKRGIIHLYKIGLFHVLRIENLRMMFMN